VHQICIGVIFLPYRLASLRRRKPKEQEAAAEKEEPKRLGPVGDFGLWTTVTTGDPSILEGENHGFIDLTVKSIQ